MELLNIEFDWLDDRVGDEPARGIFSLSDPPAIDSGALPPAWPPSEPGPNPLLMPVCEDGDVPCAHNGVLTREAATNSPNLCGVMNMLLRLPPSHYLT